MTQNPPFTSMDLAEAMLLQTGHDEREVRTVCRAFIESERLRRVAEGRLRRIYDLLTREPSDV
jgi:hypothetical protein